MTTARPINLFQRPCDPPYIGTKDAGVMAKKITSKRLRNGKKKRTTSTAKLRQRSKQFPTPISPKVTSFPISDLSLCTRNKFGRKPSRTPSPLVKAIRKRALRRYHDQLIERSIITKPLCEPFHTQEQQSTITLPPNDMPDGLDLCRRSGARTLFRHPALVDIINKVEAEEKDRDRLHGLVTCAEEFKQSQKMNCKCVDIQSLGHGSWNCAYRLTFSNGDTLAALVSNYEPRAFSRKMKESEIATMQYLRSSPLYNKHIKVPEVYAWDLSHDNKAGAPYIFREVIEGKDLSREFQFLTKEQQLAVTTAIARVHKVLSQPTKFTKIGGIYRSSKGEFYTGGYPGTWSPSRPFTSIEDLWKEKLESGTDRSGLDQSGRLAPNQGQLRELADNFSPPGRLSRLCIQHFDLAIRNVVFNDKFEITGVIDWEYAQVVPLAIAAKIPLDFEYDPELADSYAAAYNDPILQTSQDDFNDSHDYIAFHELIMGPDHTPAKNNVSKWIVSVQSYLGEHQPCNRSLHKNNGIIRFPPELRADLRRLASEGPELGNGCS